MASSIKDVNKQRRKRAKLYLISVAAGALTLFLAVDISGIGGNIEFYSKWVECGQKPVITRHGYKSPSYYEQTQAFSIIRLPHGEYFCSPLEAEAAGISANEDRYIYPNLHQLSQEERDRMKSEAELNDVSDEADNRLQISATIFIVGAITTSILYYRSRKA